MIGGGLEKRSPARGTIFSETQPILPRRQLLRCGEVELQQRRPDVAAKGATGEELAVAEDMDPPLHGFGPVDPDVVDCVLFGGGDASSSDGSLDLECDPVFRQELLSQLFLLGLEQGPTSSIKGL